MQTRGRPSKLKAVADMDGQTVLAWLTDLLGEGMTIPEIAERYDLDHTTIYKYIYSQGLRPETTYITRLKQAA